MYVVLDVWPTHKEAIEKHFSKEVFNHIFDNCYYVKSLKGTIHFVLL